MRLCITAPLDPFGAAPHRAADEKSHQAAGNEFVIGNDQNRQRRHRQHVARPRQPSPAKQEEQDIEQHLDRDRPSRPVEELLHGGWQPLLRHQEPGHKTLPVAGLENEILPGFAPEPELQQRHRRQGCKMQGVEPRKAQQRKLRPAGAARGNRLAIEPEEDKAGEREKQIHRRPAGVIKRLECPIKRLRRALPAFLIGPRHGEEMLPVPEHHRQRCKPAQGIQ